jgi:hypothetical protein
LLENSLWIPVKDTDPRVAALYRAHYSCHNPSLNFTRYGISGQGQSLTLITLDCKALFGWIHNTIERMDKQTGINCFVFRNTSNILSSVLILDAEQWALAKWGVNRLFTYVNPEKISSSEHKYRNPKQAGYCFIKAGWNKCGESKKGLVILEKLMGGTK